MEYRKISRKRRKLHLRSDSEICKFLYKQGHISYLKRTSTESTGTSDICTIVRKTQNLTEPDVTHIE